VNNYRPEDGLKLDHLNSANADDVVLNFWGDRNGTAMKGNRQSDVKFQDLKVKIFKLKSAAHFFLL